MAVAVPASFGTQGAECSSLGLKTSERRQWEEMPPIYTLLKGLPGLLALCPTPTLHRRGCACLALQQRGPWRMREQPAPVLVGVLRPGRADRPVEVLKPVLVPLPVVVLHPDVPAVVQCIGVSCAQSPKVSSGDGEEGVDCKSMLMRLPLPFSMSCYLHVIPVPADCTVQKLTSA